MRSWFFFDSNKRTQVEVEEGHLARFLRSVPNESVPFTFVWQPGWKAWAPLVKVPEMITMRAASPPPPPPMGYRYPAEGKEVEYTSQKLKVVKEDTGSDFIQRFHKPAKEQEREKSHSKPNVTAVASKTKTRTKMTPDRERRSAQRVDGRLKVMVKFGDHVFKTYTTNASTKGVLLEHPVPSIMMDQEVELYIYSPDLKTCLRIVARLIEDQKVPQRLKFTATDDLGEHRLLSWISTLSQSTQRIAQKK